MQRNPQISAGDIDPEALCLELFWKMVHTILQGIALKAVFSGLSWLKKIGTRKSSPNIDTNIDQQH